MSFAALLLFGATIVVVAAGVVVGFLLKGRSSDGFSEFKKLRADVENLRDEVDRLRAEMDRIKAGSSAASTDIRER